MTIRHLLLLAGLWTAAPAAAVDIRYVGQQALATGSSFGGTEIGGLSGLTWLGGSSYAAISDDRSDLAPARFYRFDLAIAASGFTAATPTAVTTIKTPGGSAYAAGTIDAEAIRRRANGNLLITSEGDTSRGIDAFIHEITPQGDFVRAFTVPALVQQTGSNGTTGVRNNYAFEGLSGGDGQLLVAVENALKQDGPLASLATGSPARLLSYDAATGQPGAQFVYPVEPVPFPTVPSGRFMTNGIVEILALGGTRSIALERSYSPGHSNGWSTTGYSAKLWLVDTAGATDVSAITSLTGASYTPVTKTLLLDLDSLEIPLDSLEGMTWGAPLPGGGRSLVLVSDNNFLASQFTQFVAFEVTGVPEPSSWAMLVTGFGLLGTALRRRGQRLA